MATVIYRQSDPMADQIQATGNSISDSLQKQQSLKLTGQYYKIMAKNADTEQQKAHLERLSKLTSDFLPQIAATTDPATKSMLIKAVTDSDLYGGDHNQFFKDMATVQPQVDSNHQSVSGKPMGGGQQQGQGGQQQGGQQPQSMAQGMQQMQGGQYATPGQLAASQANESAQKARVDQLTGNIMQNPRAYMQQMSGDGQQEGGQQPPAQGGGQGISGQPQVQDMANQGPVMSGMNVQAGPVTASFTNPRAKYLEAMAGSAGTQYADKQFQMAPFKQSLSDLKSSLNQAIQEQGGPSSSEMEAGIKGFGGKFLGEIKPNSAIAGFDDSLNTMANGLTSEINHGRPNTVELNGVKEGMPNRSHSAVTNAILFRRLNNMATMPGDKPEDWASMLNQSKMLGRGDDQVVQSLKGMGWDDTRINAQLRRMHQRDGDL